MIFKKNTTNKQNKIITTTAMMKLLAAQCGQNFFEIAYEFFGCACLYYEKKITSRMVEELNLVKLLQGEKNRNKNEMRL